MCVLEYIALYIQISGIESNGDRRGCRFANVVGLGGRGVECQRKAVMGMPGSPAASGYADVKERFNTPSEYQTGTAGVKFRNFPIVIRLVR